VAHRDKIDSRLTCLKSGEKRTLVRSAIDANDPTETSAAKFAVMHNAAFPTTVC
jgi:hypothetical protein